MRVLHALGELRASGAEVMLRTAGPLWREYGVAADIVAIGDHVGPFAPDLERVGYGVHHLRVPGRMKVLHNFSSLLRHHEYDVVHLHSEWAFMYLALIGRVHGSAVVRTVHSNFPFEGALRQERTIQRQILRSVGVRFASISAMVAENERERFRNPTSRVDNWFDTERFSLTTPQDRAEARSQLDIPLEAFVAVTVGNCSPTKNHGALLHALAGLSDPVSLLHVGEEEPGQPERRLLEQLDGEARCRFLGRDDPLPALRAADVFVMPSLYEGFSIASLEALATGLPAVLTEVPGNLDLAALTEMVLWSGTDSEALGSALASAYRQWGRSLNLEREGQSARLQRQYSPSEGVARYVQLYREAIG